MKLIKKLLLLAAASTTLTAIATAPEPTTKTEQKKAGKIIAKPAQPTDRFVSLRPKAPSRQRVTCSYDGEYLTVDFVIPEGECEVAIAEWYSGTVQTYTIDSTDLTAQINVGELYESTITISTESGNTYTTDLTATDDE